MTFVASPVNHWHEDPTNGPALTIAFLYWSYDAGTSTWTLVENRSDADGELVDLTPSGTFTLELLGVGAVSKPRLNSAERGGDVFLIES